MAWVLHPQLAGVVATAVWVLTACAEPADETSGSRVDVVRPGADYVVPAVGDPLDLRQLADDPCQLLTKQQAADLGLPRAQQTPPSMCKWSDDSGSLLDALHAGPRTRGGLTSAYQQYLRTGERQGFTSSWEPVTVEGYPAAYVNVALEREYGQCVLQVGVADDQVLRVEDSSSANAAKAEPSGTAACARATKAAEQIIGNLRRNA